ncbi:MAG: tetratricopeptide repeat protein [Bacteroidaceae bacterium]|nr:tetratricopeptide repeat protein [Bacteroidaceae bacterium]
MKYTLSIILVALLSFNVAIAQNKNTARKLFLAGEYAEAKPMFEKLLSRNPKNSELNYWYAVCCYETKDTADIKEMLEFAASRKITNAYRYLGDLCADSALYTEAAVHYEDFLSLCSDDSLTALYKEKLSSVNRLSRMINTTEKVCVIDSFVVDKDKFLSAYKMGRDVGLLASVADFFDEDDEDGGYLAETERGTDIYYAMKNEGDSLLKLYHSSKVDKEWGRPSKLAGFETNGNDNYPFMLADGVTLYFASDGDGSIGGYDIFITRYDNEASRFLRPDNVGMPFNSQANDYMLAINEVANLGWFASDRRQPEGKVCVYVFVPNASAVKYDAENMPYNKLLSCARLTAIAATQVDEDVVREARRQQTILFYEQPEEGDDAEFFFVIDNAADYTALSDFRSAEARELFIKWQKGSIALQKNEALLQCRRDEYATANDVVKKNLSAEIMRLERQVELDASTLELMEYEIRKLELKKLHR